MSDSGRCCNIEQASGKRRSRAGPGGVYFRYVLRCTDRMCYESAAQGGRHS